MSKYHENALTPGYTLAEYTIESVLGHGGFGITYLARDNALGADVAIKEYLPQEIAARDDRTAAVVPRASEDAVRLGIARAARGALVLLVIVAVGTAGWLGRADIAGFWRGVVAPVLIPATQPDPEPQRPVAGTARAPVRAPRSDAKRETREPSEAFELPAVLRSILSVLRGDGDAGAKPSPHRGEE